jgi:glucose/mannose transport system substrate-binding protein
MKRPAVVLCILLALAASLSAAPAEVPPARPAKSTAGLTFYHWWTSSSELAAVNALVGVFKKQHPGVAVNVTVADSHGGGRKIFTIISSATSAGQPPDSFQVHAGAPLQPYFAADLLNQVDRAWILEGLDKVTPSMIRTMSSIQGHYYIVPVNVHRNNLIWYNKLVLDKHRIDPATLTTWDAFFKAAEKLRTAGVRNPLQLGVAWTASVAFESIMASQGVPAYQDWINGKMTTAEDPRLLATFGILKTYVSYANPDHATTGWDAAIKRVASGESAFCMMGDWANGEFRLADRKYGKDYGAIPVPGTKDLYGATIDAFAQTRGLANPTNSNRWMRLAASREGQDAFNSIKGSISVRTDADPAHYDPYQRSAIADFKTARVIYPNIATGTHDAFKVRLDEVAARFVADLDVQKAAAAISAAAAGSQAKFTRVWSLK